MLYLSRRREGVLLRSYCTDTSTVLPIDAVLQTQTGAATSTSTSAVDDYYNVQIGYYKLKPYYGKSTPNYGTCSGANVLYAALFT